MSKASIDCRRRTRTAGSQLIILEDAATHKLLLLSTGDVRPGQDDCSNGRCKQGGATYCQTQYIKQQACMIVIVL
jgi:hypothetical protein